MTKGRRLGHGGATAYLMALGPATSGADKILARSRVTRIQYLDCFHLQGFHPPTHTLLNAILHPTIAVDASHPTHHDVLGKG